jgi:hypothetical protein
LKRRIGKWISLDGLITLISENEQAQAHADRQWNAASEEQPLGVQLDAMIAAGGRRYSR